MRIEEDIKLCFKDVVLKPKRSEVNSRSDVDLVRSFTFKNSGRSWTGVPIVASNIHTVGTFAMFHALKKRKLFTCIHRYYSKTDWRYFLKNIQDKNDYKYMAITSGIKDNDYKFVNSVLEIAPEIEFLCFDVANGYANKYINFIKRLRDDYPDKTIIAGNVVTGEMTEQLILAGADIVKVGIGQSSTGKTRYKTGVGYPQLSAIIECADAAHGIRGHIMSDGGCANPGDVAKAIAAGADFVMLGGLLSGHDENGGDIVTDKDNPHQKYKIFYGNKKDNSKKDIDDNSKYGKEDGLNIMLEYKGSVSDTVHNILGGLRSACAYTGSFSLKEMFKRATFVKIQNAIENYSEYDQDLFYSKHAD